MNKHAALAAAALLLTAQAQAQTVILYAHADARCQAPIAAMASIYGPVVDYQSQRPGTLWRPSMARQILRARVVLVLWSASAALSSELATELRLAYAARQARLVPILLDGAPMPPELATRHAINLEHALCASSLPP